VAEGVVPKPPPLFDLSPQLPLLLAARIQTKLERYFQDVSR
jgi:hypothetical protein